MTRRILSRNAAATAAASAIVVTSIAGCLSSDPARAPSALQSAFPSARRVREVAVDDRRAYVVEGTSGPIGYGLEMEVVSRSGPFTILVSVDAAFHVRSVSVPSYPGERGGEVQRPRFRRQFVGKGAEDPIRIGKDIDAETGATISSRVMADGVRRAIRLLRNEFGSGSGSESKLHD